MAPAGRQGEPWYKRHAAWLGAAAGGVILALGYQLWRTPSLAPAGGEPVQAVVVQPQLPTVADPAPPPAPPAAAPPAAPARQVVAPAETPVRPPQAARPPAQSSTPAPAPVSPPAPAPSPAAGLRDSAPRQPTRWQDYIGFDDLVGRWRGADRDGLVIEMEIPRTEADEVLATLSIPRMGCSMSVRLVQATQQFTTSQFFWKTVSASAGCPEMETLYTNPVQNVMTWRFTFSSGQSTQVVLDRRI